MFAPLISTGTSATIGNEFGGARAIRRLRKFWWHLARHLPALALALVVLSVVSSAYAACVNQQTGGTATQDGGADSPTTGQSVICSGVTSAPPNDINVTSASGSTGVTVLVTSGSSLSTFVRAIGLNGGSSTVENDGTITTTTGLNAFGINSTGSGNTVINNGTIGTSSSRAHGISATGSGTNIINSGTISVTGLGATGIRSTETSAATSITNTGTISASGGAYDASTLANGVSLAGGTFINSGSVSSTQAYGVLGVGSRGITVQNSGTITGGNGVAIQFGSGNDALVLLSGSVVNGAVDGGGGTNGLFLQGGGTVSNAFTNIQNLDVQSGTWGWTGSGSFLTTVIDAGATLQLGDGSAGYASSSIVDNGSLVFDQSGDPMTDLRSFASVISGSGSLVQDGTNTIILTGNNSYTGPTIVNSGFLYIDGDQSAATGPVIVNGGRLGGEGISGGAVTLASGSVLAPGVQPLTPATLAINGSLTAASGSTLFYNVVQPGVSGGANNDLTVVHGDLALNGATLRILDQPENAGGFPAGIYHIIDYDGSLLNSDVTIDPQFVDGSMADTARPIPADLLVSASIPHEIVLISTGGIPTVFWDGANHQLNGTIDGGDGIWTAYKPGLNENWTGPLATVNGPFNNGAFAIFSAAPGTVTVDQSVGAVVVSGMQFASDGYLIQGDPINLIDSTSTPGVTVIRVGDGSTLGASMEATIASILTGTTTLEKADLGRLILTGANTYSGGTTISNGTLQLGNGGTTGSILGDVTDNGTLAFDRSDTFTFAGAISGSGSVSQIGTGTTTLVAASTYTGTTDIMSGTLAAGGSNVFSAASTFNVDAGGTLDLAGFDQTLGNVNDAGIIALNGTGPGTTLTITGNYVGLGGVLSLNSVLADSSSLTDRLVIAGSGATATGNTALLVNNVGGPGALTTGNGILLVDAIGGGTTAPGAFSLAVPLVAGPYEYDLFRSAVDGSNDDAWYLRSTLDCALPINAEACAAPPVPAPIVPNYRPETSTYAAIPSLALIYGRSLLDTLHERVGDEENPDLRAAAYIGAWGRLIGIYGNENHGNVLKGTGPQFDYNVAALQAGHDLLGGEHADGSRDHAGLYLSYGKTSGRVTHIDGTVGDVGLLAATLGGYWTHFFPSGGYLDLISQETLYGVSASNNRGLAALTSNGLGFAASLEAGQPMRFGDGDFIEPQAQFVYQNIAMGSTWDAGGPVSFSGVDSAAARLGLRVGRSWKPNGRTSLTAWVRPNVWYEFQGNSQTEFSSVAGPVSFPSSLHGARAEINLGIDGQINAGTSIFANASYQTSFDGSGNALDAKFGFRLSW